MKGFVTYMIFGDGSESRNALVWPDAESAEKAGYDLLMRWFVPVDYRVAEVNEEPTRPTWDEHVKAHGLPPKSVKV